MAGQVKEFIDTVKRFKELWDEMKEIGGQITEPLGKLLEMEKVLAEALAQGPSQWQFKHCSPEYRELYEAANGQRERLLPLTKKNAGYWIQFSGAAIGGAAGAGDMVQKTDQALFKLLEARKSFGELQAAADGAAMVLEAMKVLEFAQTISDVASLSPDQVRTTANLVAGKSAYNACKGCVMYIDKINPALDRAIEIVTDLNNEVHRFFKTLTSKYTFLDFLKMYAEEMKAKKKQESGS